MDICVKESLECTCDECLKAEELEFIKLQADLHAYESMIAFNSYD